MTITPRAALHLMPAPQLPNWAETSGREATLLLGVLVLLMIGANTFQDYLHAAAHHYRFYFSESLLFKVNWVLLGLTVGVQLYFLKRQRRPRSPVGAVVALIGMAALLAALHSLLFAQAVHLLSALFLDHTYPVGKLLRYAVSDNLSAYALLYLPVGLMYLRPFAPQGDAPRLQETPASESEFLQTIMVGAGRNTAVVAAADIFSICASNPYVTIHTQGKKHLYSASLKSIHEQLDPAQFVRIHKSTIVNLAHVASYTSRLNGDYDVLLKNGQLVRLSRSYAAAFKQHLVRRSAGGAAKSSG